MKIFGSSAHPLSSVRRLAQNLGSRCLPACIALSSALLVSACATTADTEISPYQVSLVDSHGMPRDITPRKAKWNFGSGSLWTHNGMQYAAYWDDQRQVSVARRKLPKGDWEAVSLPGYERTENINRGTGGPISRGFGDGHEKVVLGISADGIIHLSFDHHVSPFHYRTSVAPVANAPEQHPWSSDLFGPEIDNLGGPPIAGVTYPWFVNTGEQLILHLRLNGGSGAADTHLLDYQDGEWLTKIPSAGKLIDKHWSGGNGTVNAYPHTLATVNGRWHLTWCWRDTPDSSTNHDFCYAYSDDKGTTWRNNDGEVIGVRGSRFITADSPGVSVFPIPPGTQYINGGSMTVDPGGGVHVVMRGETGKPVYFRRDPSNGSWSRHVAPERGTLIADERGFLYLVATSGLYRASYHQFETFEKIADMPSELFEDSSMVVDRNRKDGWISVIGQSGKKVSVVDFQIHE